MHWIYILRCEDDIIYVGETERLYRRINEHRTGRGADTTKDFKPYMLMGVYKLIKDGLTFTNTYAKELYDDGEIAENKLWALELENKITLMCMKVMGSKWENVFGGKYHVGYRPLENPSNNITLYRPYCKCKIPADIHEFKDQKYWRCCRKNVFEGLGNFLSNMNIIEPNCCDYYKKFNENDKYICEKFMYYEKDIVKFKCSKCEKNKDDIILTKGKLLCGICK